MPKAGVELAQAASQVGRSGSPAQVKEAVTLLEDTRRRIYAILAQRFHVLAVDLGGLMMKVGQYMSSRLDVLAPEITAELEGLQDEVPAVPTLAWERTTRIVLTLEDVTAINISDVEGLRAASIDPVEVALLFADVMYDQFFNHGFFHADLHPGNIFVTPLDGGPEDRKGKLTFIDFGMMGEIPGTTRADATLRTVWGQGIRSSHTRHNCCATRSNLADGAHGQR